MCIIGLKSDGGVVAAGGGNSNALEITGWTDIVQVVADYDNVRGLRSDGTVITSGNPHLGDCNTSGWTDIVAPISLDYCFRSDGTVVHARDEIQVLLEGWTDMKLPQTAQNPFAPGGFSYDASTEKMDYAADYQEAERLLAAGDTAGAAMAFGKLGDYEDARQRSFSLWENTVVRDILSVGNFHTLALKTDGTVYAAGEHIGTWNTMTQRGEGSYGTVRNADSWTDIMEISASASDSAGLKTDGTVVSAIKDGWGSTGDWKDIVSISYDGFLMGLKTDGTVAISGGFAYQSLVCDWTEIVSIEAGGTHAVGLKADGTVVAVGRNDHGECDVEDWTDIVKISAGANLTLGLKSDGTVVAAGLNDHGQTKVEHWTDIQDISTSGTLAIGVKSDGSVVAEGRIMGWYDPRSWTDIVAVAAGENHLVGLKSDGSLISIGNSRFGQCDFNGWTDLKLPKS